MLLRDKNAIITGSNRGIGKATLEVFAENGANIWACARKRTEEFETECRILAGEYGVIITPIYFDFSDSEQIKSGIRNIVSENKKIDILVNNAGIVGNKNLFQMTAMEDIKKVFEVNFFSPMFLAQSISRIMAKKNTGNIINIASIAGIDGDPAQFEYVTSKAALIGATKKLAIELGRQGIRVNAIAPGPTNTTMSSELKDELFQATIGKTIMKRLGEPIEIAKAVLFLASDMSSFITGQVLRVDGGM
ncbi:MAG: SDR family NAD(P)-dependent oxidoreductase [Ruminiclostridium sp.]